VRPIEAGWRGMLQGSDEGKEGQGLRIAENIMFTWNLFWPEGALGRGGGSRARRDIPSPMAEAKWLCHCDKILRKYVIVFGATQGAGVGILKFI